MTATTQERGTILFEGLLTNGGPHDVWESGSCEACEAAAKKLACNHSGECTGKAPPACHRSCHYSPAVASAVGRGLAFTRWRDGEYPVELTPQGYALFAEQAKKRVDAMNKRAATLRQKKKQLRPLNQD